MKKYEIHKYAYTDKTSEELQFNLAFYESRLVLLQEELEFFKHVLGSTIFNPKTPNLFENIELFKAQIDQHMKLTSKLTTTVEKQYKEVQLKVECDELSCDDYFLRNYHDTELELVSFLTQTAQFKSEMMEYLKGIIL
ncbi:hypothetical protein [Gelidibacter salicanalis]|uniref:Uncharacterized protein n=1 Tax=Gelidibacter salicanalis TaxID=291193 RepID=A0A934NIF7_9FLAO|nr:hypothetical protein [Gelidibacter salicanalis]MBJ7882061.1 hypothetical protein [Gelidibacter salicanalis]